MTPAASEVIAQLRLEPLPGEGGFFRQTWRDAAGSAIYFLITPENFSALHRLRQPEIWHFYAGDRVEHVQISAAGVICTLLGADVLHGERPQLAVPAGTWQGAHSAVSGHPPRHGWSLLGCTLAPPWDDHASELAERAALLSRFPAHAAIIRALTR